MVVRTEEAGVLVLVLAAVMLSVLALALWYGSLPVKSLIGDPIYEKSSGGRVWLII